MFYPKRNSTAKCYVTRHRQMVQFDDIGDGGKSLTKKQNILILPTTTHCQCESYLPRNSFTLAKWLSPSLTSGVVGNIRCGDMHSEPPFNEYKFDMTSRRSEVFLTGKKRDRGTLMPMEPSKHFMAAPTAVSSWMIRTPVSKVLWLTIVSMFNVLCDRTRSIAERIWENCQCEWKGRVGVTQLNENPTEMKPNRIET